MELATWKIAWKKEGEKPLMSLLWWERERTILSLTILTFFIRDQAWFKLSVSKRSSIYHPNHRFPTSLTKDWKRKSWETTNCTQTLVKQREKPKEEDSTRSSKMKSWHREWATRNTRIITCRKSGEPIRVIKACFKVFQLGVIQHNWWLISRAFLSSQN